MSNSAKKIASNATELRIAKEETLGVLPAAPLWYEGEPNSYADFGGNLTLVARNPINAGRQRKKGVITDLDASGGYNQDLTFSNLSFLWPGVLLAKRIDQNEFVGVTNVDGTAEEYEAAGIETGFVPGQIVLATGFGETANNGLKTVSIVAAGVLTVAEDIVDEVAPPATAKLEVVGIQGGDAEIDMVAASGVTGPTISRVAGTLDFTTFGLIPGQPIYIGGDAATNRFANEENNGWFRIKEITATTIEFDKSDGGADGETEPSDETGTGISLQIFVGSTTRNVSSLSSDFDCATYHIERALGKGQPVAFPNAIQSEVIKGSIVNEVAVNIAQADKINVDYTFIGTDNEQRDGLTAAERGDGEDENRLSDSVGTLANVAEATAYNTSSDFSRVRLARVNSAADTAPEPLFAYVTEITLSVSNNATPDKAIGCLGAFDVTPGTIEVSGSLEAYFGDINAVKAVRENADVTLDMALVKDFTENGFTRKSGIFFDLPLIALGDGRLNVEQDQAIKLPLQVDAAEYEAFGHTVLVTEFSYLPELADEDIC